MIFTAVIVLGIVIIAVAFIAFVVSLVTASDFYLSDFVIVSLGVVGVGLVLGLFCNFMAYTTGQAEPRTDVVQLRAFGDGDALMSGRFFLGSGAIDSEPTIEYIAKYDGYSVKEHIDADQARIIEDGKTEMHVVYTVRNSPIWWPDPIRIDGHTEFHIPAGSVKESYSVEVGK